MKSKEKRIFVAGHRGMVGSALMRRLEQEEASRLITRTRAEVDLTRQKHVEEFLGDEHIDQVYLAAARVGGISANDHFPADFIYENLLIEANVIHAAFETAIDRLLLLGSSCIYPRDADQPITEDSLLTGSLELTNESYAVAKIAGIKLCESYNRQWNTDFRCIMPCNLYGPNDNFDLETSHVLPALLRKAYQAKLDGAGQLEVWGSGTPRREFLHVDDAADACVHLMGVARDAFWSVAQPRCSQINIGAGKDISVRELAEMIAKQVGFRGDVVFDHSRPDGTLGKLLDVSRQQALGWSPGIGLHEGIASTLQWLAKHWGEVTRER